MLGFHRDAGGHAPVALIRDMAPSCASKISAEGNDTTLKRYAPRQSIFPPPEGNFHFRSSDQNDIRLAAAIFQNITAAKAIAFTCSGVCSTWAPDSVARESTPSARADVQYQLPADRRLNLIAGTPCAEVCCLPGCSTARVRRAIFFAQTDGVVV